MVAQSVGAAKPDGQTFTRYARASFKAGPHGYFDTIGLVRAGGSGLPTQGGLGLAISPLTSHRKLKLQGA
jgi:hypothetical protein